MNNENRKTRLDRVQGLIVREQDSAAHDDFPAHYVRMASVLEGELCTNYAGAFCRIRTLYPPHYALGQATLGDASNRDSLPVSAFTLLDKPGTVDISALLFLDTETTGLGGVGAVAFLIGCGSVVSDGFEVRQYIIPDYSDEAAMLEAVLSELAHDKTIVTYNGAAFDLPLLRDRMIVNRVARDIDMAGHFDLLHVTRRLFGRRLRDCTLANVERELFHFFRQDDPPGYLIPSIYFDWLSEQKLDSMTAVIEHNRRDIVSLYVLANCVARAFQSEGETLEQIEDLHSLARVYSRRKRNNRAIDLYRRIEDMDGRPVSGDMILAHAQALKRTGDSPRAVILWQKLSASPSKEGYWANLELAKYFEHKTKDFHTACHHARLAERLSPYGNSHAPDLRKRLRRLSRKMAL